MTFQNREQYDRPSIRYLLLAHHPPSHIHRTIELRIGSIRQPVCARCLGLYFGIVAFSAVQLALGLKAPTLPWVLVAALGPVPAAVDWATQTMNLRESRNWLRIITGASCGCSISMALVAATRAEFARLVLLGGIFLLYLVVVFWLLKRAGVIESYLKPLEDYVAKRQNATQLGREGKFRSEE